MTIMFTGCYFMPVEKKYFEPTLIDPVGVTYETLTVKKGDIENSISFECELVSVNTINACLDNVMGRVSAIYHSLGDNVNEGDILFSIDTESLEYSIKLQEYTVERAMLYYDKIKALADEGADMSYELAAASISLELAQIRLDSLNVTLGRSCLRAPISGKIISVDPGISIGYLVYPYMNLYTIADMSSLQLQYIGVATDLMYIMKGVIVQVDYKGGIYEGEVLSVDPYTTSSSDSIGTQKRILIKVKDLPEDARLAEKADISLVLERSEDTVIIPKQAVQIYAGKYYIQVLVDGVKEEREVKTGIKSSAYIEITEGLEEGDQLITGS
jgi:RND family efflux transporter MFP subunit